VTTTTTTPTITDADKAAVAGLPGRIIAAWTAHDAQAFAEVFTEDGSMILPGLYKQGRAEIATHMTGAFAGPYRGTQVTGQPLDLRFLSADTAVVITEGGVLKAGETELPGDAIVRATWVAARQDGEWLLAAYQNTPRDA